MVYEPHEILNLHQERMIMVAFILLSTALMTADILLQQRSVSSNELIFTGKLHLKKLY